MTWPFSTKKISDETRNALQEKLSELFSYLDVLSEGIMEVEDLSQARLINEKQKIGIASARECLKGVLRIWPEGKDFWSSMDLYLKLMYDLLENSMEWKLFLENEYLKQNSPTDSAAQKYRLYVQKNREIAAQAQKYFDKAGEALNKFIGL
jgi:hypothetical protein